jgi:hypothetical protein
MYYLGKTAKVRGTKPVQQVPMPQIEEPAPLWPIYIGGALAAFFIYKALSK